MGILNDIVNGKEKKIKADPLAGDINSAAKSGIGYLTSGASKLNDVYNQDPNQYINNQISMENKLIRGASDDAAKRTAALMAQRGMGSSSIGLGQEVNAAKQLNDKIAMNNASGIDRLRGLQIENAQGQINAGNSLFNLKQAQGPVQMTDTTYRTGGYGQLIGGALSAGGTLGAAALMRK